MSVALYARGGLAAVAALEKRRLGRLQQPSRAHEVGLPRPRGPGAPAQMNADAGVRRDRSDHARDGEELRLGNPRPAWPEAACDRCALRFCAQGGRPRRPAGARAGRARELAGRGRVAPGSAGRRRDPRRARGRDGALCDSAPGAVDLVDGALMDCEQAGTRTGTSCASIAAGRRRRRSRVRGGLRADELGGRAAAGGDARPGAAADQHHARRRRGLVARPCLSPAGRAAPVRGRRGRDRRRPLRGLGGSL